MKILAIAAALVLMMVFMSACGGTPGTSANVTPGAMPQYRTITVVSVVGPIPPFNPSSPVVEITLKNDGNEPFTTLRAILQLEKPYECNFPVTKDKPLPAGQSISIKQTLIGASWTIDSAATYTLFLTAITQSGSTIAYSVQVEISVQTRYLKPALTTNEAERYFKIAFMSIHGLVSSRGYFVGFNISNSGNETAENVSVDFQNGSQYRLELIDYYHPHPFQPNSGTVGIWMVSPESGIKAGLNSSLKITVRYESGDTVDYLQTITIGEAEYSMINLMQSMVQVWNPEIMIGTGCAVLDGTRVVTVLDYRKGVPDNLTVIDFNGATHPASLQTYDPRNGATVLKLEDGKLPAALFETSMETLEIDQVIQVYDWMQLGITVARLPDNWYFNTPPIGVYSARVSHDIFGSPKRFQFRWDVDSSYNNFARFWFTAGEPVSSLKAVIWGLVGNDYWGILSPDIEPQKNPIVISSLDFSYLLSTDNNGQPVVSGPVGFNIATPDRVETYTDVPRYYDEVSGELQTIFTRLGEAIPSASVKTYCSDFPYHPSSGHCLMAQYAVPVQLRSEKGDNAISAKWIYVYWGTGAGHTDCIFYGNEPNVVDGGFTLNYDFSELDALFSN
jgi:hypothetical protein